MFPPMWGYFTHTSTLQSTEVEVSRFVKKWTRRSRLRPPKAIFTDDEFGLAQFGWQCVKIGATMACRITKFTANKPPPQQYLQTWLQLCRKPLVDNQCNMVLAPHGFTRRKSGPGISLAPSLWRHSSKSLGRSLHANVRHSKAAETHYWTASGFIQ